MKRILLLFLLVWINACAVKSVQIPVNYKFEAGNPVSYAEYFPISSIKKYVEKSYEYVYLTTEDKRLVTASALYLIPFNPSRKIVVFAHPATGISLKCGMDNSLYQFVLSKFVNSLLKKHYIVILPNYRGLGISNAQHKFLNAEESAMDVLDAARAAISLFKLPEDIPIIFWGYSQGGQATQRASELAHIYAKDLNIIGSIQNSAPLLLSTSWHDILNKKISMPLYLVLPYVVSGAVRSNKNLKYSDFSSWKLIKDENLSMCGTSSILLFIVSNPWMDLDRIPKEKMQILFEFLKEQDAPKYQTKIPLLIIQGKKDKIVKPEWQSEIVSRLCQKGMIVSKITRNGGHLNLKDIEISLKWINDRFLHQPVLNACTSDFGQNTNSY